MRKKLGFETASQANYITAAINKIQQRLVDIGVWEPYCVTADGIPILQQSTEFHFYGKRPRRCGDDAIITVDGVRVRVRLRKGSDKKKWLVAL